MSRYDNINRIHSAIVAFRYSIAISQYRNKLRDQLERMEKKKLI